MRLLALIGCVAAVALSGCLRGVDLGNDLGDLDCSSDIEQVVGQTADLLVPPETPSQVPSGNPSVTVTARAGQTVTAQVVWQAAAGVAQPTYDGPDGTITTGTTITWQLVATDVPAGDVTLGLAGDPFAFGVSYTLQLTATGCTPR